MNVTTQVALTTEYKIKEWYHMNMVQKFRPIKHQLEALFTYYSQEDFIPWKPY